MYNWFNKAEFRDQVFETLNLRRDRLMVEASKIAVAEAARFKIVRARVRKGKILRRHKQATNQHYTFRQGKLTRMSPQERRRRRISQRKGAIKRRAKRAQSKINTRKAQRRRKSIGLK